MRILILPIPDADTLQSKRMELEMTKIKQKELAQRQAELTRELLTIDVSIALSRLSPLELEDLTQAPALGQRTPESYRRLVNGGWMTGEPFNYEWTARGEEALRLLRGAQ
jgi:hypothetical protein